MIENQQALKTILKPRLRRELIAQLDFLNRYLAGISKNVSVYKSLEHERVRILKQLHG